MMKKLLIICLMVGAIRDTSLYGKKYSGLSQLGRDSRMYRTCDDVNPAFLYRGGVERQCDFLEKKLGQYKRTGDEIVPAWWFLGTLMTSAHRKDDELKAAIRVILEDESDDVKREEFQKLNVLIDQIVKEHQESLLRKEKEEAQRREKERNKF